MGKRRPGDRPVFLAFVYVAGYYSGGRHLHFAFMGTAVVATGTPADLAETNSERGPVTKDADDIDDVFLLFCGTLRPRKQCGLLGTGQEWDRECSPGPHFPFAHLLSCDYDDVRFCN